MGTQVWVGTCSVWERQSKCMQDVSFSHLTLNSAIALKPILQNKCQSRPEPPLGDSNQGLLPLSGNARLAKARGQAPPGSHTAGPATCFEGTAYQKSPCSCRNVLASLQVQHPCPQDVQHPSAGRANQTTVNVLGQFKDLTVQSG